jgi:hypothetical protein
MTTNRLVARLTRALVIWGGFCLWWISPPSAAAYWDSLVGPMGLDARQALEVGELGPLVKWVRLEDAFRVRAALNKTMSLTTKYPDSREILARSFFGTLITIRQDADRAATLGLPARPAMGRP